MLYTSGIDYKYEEKLYYDNDKYILPDFTIIRNSKTYFWEHLGLIGVENYDERWLKKKKIYNKYFSSQLLITYEDVLLTENTKNIIKKIKKQTDK